MEFGVNTSPRGALTSPEAYASVAQAAERLGFGFLSVSDHVVMPRDNSSRYPYNEDGKMGVATLGHCFDQLTTLAFLAGCTKYIGLLSSVMVVPHRQVVLAAKMLATADVLSGGRLRVGCGAGWLREEFEALETKPFDERGRVTDEYIEAFKELWTKDDPRYEGRHVRFSDIVFEPKPAQRPHPPIWIGGESLAAMRRAMRLGDVWYPGSRNPQHRLDTPARVAAAQRQLDRMAEAEKRDPAGIGRAYIVFSPVEWSVEAGHDTPRRIFTGSGADMIEDARALEAAGVRSVNLTFQTASASETIERMQRFAEDVMPQMKA